MGYRPVVIIQNDTGNKHSPTVVVAAVTSKVDAKVKQPTHCFIGAEYGLELPSVILLDQLLPMKSCSSLIRFMASSR